MEEAPLLGGLSGPEDELVPDLFGSDSRFVSENVPLGAPGTVKAEEDGFHVFRDPFLSPADAGEPPLHELSPRLGVDGKDKVGAALLADGTEEELLGEFPGLSELDPLEGTVLPATALPPQAYSVHFLSSLLTPHRGPVVGPLGAWAPEGAAHPGVRVIPVELKEGGATGGLPQEAALQRPLSQDPCKFPASQGAEDVSPMVLCPLKGGTQMLCIDSSGARELKALRLVPQYQDPSNALQSDAPKPVAALAGRLWPVPATLNLLTQQLDDGVLPSSVVSGSALSAAGSALPGLPRGTVAGYCDCLAAGGDCCHSLRHGVARIKATKACVDRNPEAFQLPAGRSGAGTGDAKPRPGRGCRCRRSSCLKNYCECFEAQIMCSSVCKCVGCKNYEESPERKTLMATPTCVGTGPVEGGRLVPGAPGFRREGQPSCISWEVVEAACACLLAQGEEAEKGHCPEGLAQQLVLEEFGRCLSQILYLEFKCKGWTTD